MKVLYPGLLLDEYLCDACERTLLDRQMDNVEIIPIPNDPEFFTDEALEFPDLSKELATYHFNKCLQFLN